VLLALPRIAEAQVRPRVIVEISAKAERYLDSRLTRRLVEIELSDAEVPLRSGDKSEKRPTVYFRVLATSPDALRVELWDKGGFYGARRLDSRDVKELLARRIALASAALVRDLKQRRLVEARAFEAERAQRDRDRERLSELSMWPAVLFEARVTAAAVGGDAMWLSGPGLSMEGRLHSGSRLGIGVNWLFGAAPPMSGNPSVRWLELAIAPEHAFSISSKTQLAVGMLASASAVHFTGVSAVDGDPGLLDTWSSRAVARLRLEPSLGRHLRLSVGPEIGAVLRRMPVIDDAGEPHRLGGGWLGLTAGFTLDALGRL
jgi:hypothetical protein